MDEATALQNAVASLLVSRECGAQMANERGKKTLLVRNATEHRYVLLQ